jgi:hypothetical protein
VKVSGKHGIGAALHFTDINTHKYGADGYLSTGGKPI